MANLRTPLFDWHTRAGARIVPFGGWNMPVQYAGIKPEHVAVRTQLGLFDISHMGRLVLDGPDALTLTQKLWTNDAAVLKPGQIRYGLLCNDAGGMLDDILVYRLDHAGQPLWLWVVNASNRVKVLNWLDLHRAGLNVQIIDRTFDWGMIAVQGPQAVATTPSVAKLKYYTGVVESQEPVRILSRTGYTGEDGYELIVPAADTTAAWQTLIDRGAVPCGLGARDTLRLEAAMPLYGHELSESLNPLQAGLDWAVKLTKPDFVGKAALLAADRTLPVRVGLRLAGRRIAREQSVVLHQGQAVGVVTSGTLSPTLEASLAMAYVPPALAMPGTELAVDLRGTHESATVVNLPFYQRPKV
jgi:aminomethyltransferase